MGQQQGKSLAEDEGKVKSKRKKVLRWGNFGQALYKKGEISLFSTAIRRKFEPVGYRSDPCYYVGLNALQSLLQQKNCTYESKAYLLKP
ncbi:MAG: hypothetical protein H0A75_04090 [Candidatus Methanofishera endochildressiae]|uniref:Uncharacterized protein n=1 Tax=Candidatus Methanofishera endochildressiae TaxID=2738884 RepID=A0A7Z0MNN6_9GAMM|nr:hypothetical protein [Candidatus Methanofishera endochildressiae]